MPGVAVRLFVLSVLLIQAQVSHGEQQWHYSPGCLWQSFTIYSLDAQGLRALHQKPADCIAAEQCFRRVLAMRSNDYTSLVGLARCYIRAKDSVAATRQLAQAMQAWPRSAELYDELGGMQLDGKDSAKALETLRAGLAIDPQYDELYVDIGRVHEERGETDLAIQFYRQAIKLNDRSLKGHNHLAVVLYNQGRKLELGKNPQLARPIYEEVAKELQITNSIDPQYFPVYMSSGAILTNMGAFSKAEIAFKNAVYLEPTNVEAHTSLAMVQIRLKKDSDALKNLRDATRLDPKSSRAHFLFGTLAGSAEVL